ncbi:MAG TPA: class I SAM-dependent methyltransferase, partial [Chitinophagaceae bacterium]|nr:class I SAM-dependent methyltransferase [Chitinophagaceae bacterium]
IFNTNPTNILDIGAGGGHFVEACQRKNMQAKGFEFSESSIAFAKEAWDISLDHRDYTKAYQEYADYDVVTFWGLLEHVPNPLEFIKAASGSLNQRSDKMIVCRVPKWDSLSTGVQSLCSDTIVRHLDPLGHIMIYTESSLCELFRQIGYKPAAIWYYGMDMYELLMQIGHKSGNYDHLMKLGDLQQELQVLLDNFYLSDLMVMAFVPNEL